VLDIEIEPGIVTCEVQGSRPTPYIAAIEVTTGDGMPLRRDVVTRCTCPDDDNWEGQSCKHAVAAMFTFSNELLLEPELLYLWRGRSDTSGERTGGDASGAADETGPRSRRHLRLVGADDGAGADEHDADPLADVLADVLRFPAGSSLPPVPDLERFDPPAPRDPQLAAVLRDAVANARVDWD